MGNKALVPQFIPVSDSRFSIQDIKFTSDDIYSVSIQTLTSGGRTADYYTWNDWTEYPEGSGEYPGFWDDGSGVPATKTFEPGQGLWISGNVGDVMLTAGQVNFADIVYPLVNGNVLVGNAYPVPLNLQDIIANAADIYSVSIQTLTAGGRTADYYTWNDWTEYPEGSGEFPGFWDDGSGIPAVKEFAPGEALWISGALGDTIRLPAPEL